MARDDWRENFSCNAADLLAIIRWAEGLTDEQFKHLLLACFKRAPHSSRINTATVEHVLYLRRHLTEEA